MRIVPNLLCWSLLVITSFAIVGCGSTPTKSDTDGTLASLTESIESSDPTKAEKKNKSGDKKSAAAQEDNTTLDEASSAATEALLLTPVIALSSTKKGVPKRSKKQPAGVIDFCKVKPYAKSKRQVKNGIKAAWDAKVAKKYGVGFRNKAEYNKWSKTQKDFFLHMFDACRSLAMCEISKTKIAQDKKSKLKKKSCALQQATFEAWQDSAKLFATEVKKLKTQQPASLCSIQPKNGDVSLCFKKRAQQIDDACDGEVCKELSQCWASVAMKDDVIRQSESSCRFSGQKLAKCRGHIEATKNRKDRFNSCSKMQKNIDLAFQPG